MLGGVAFKAYDSIEMLRMEKWKYIKVAEMTRLTRGKKQAMFVLFFVSLLALYKPLGGAVGVLYIFCFFYLCKESKNTIIVFAGIILLIAIITFIISYSPSSNYVVHLNKAITIFVIICTTIFTVRHKNLYDRINNDRNTYVQELEEMLFMVSHRMRKPITSYLELMHIVESEKILTQDELKLIMKHVKLSAFELDTFTKELTKFISESAKNVEMKNQI